MSVNFNCTPKYFLTLPGSNKVKKGLDRYRLALSKGMKIGNRRGCNWKEAMRELLNPKANKKIKHYIWYVFPQPKPTAEEQSLLNSQGIKISEASKYFYISKSEAEEWLLDAPLRNCLFQSLDALLNAGLDTPRIKNYKQLKAYLGDTDLKKFTSFEVFFISILRHNKKIHDFLKSEGTKITNQIYDPETESGKLIGIYHHLLILFLL